MTHLIVGSYIKPTSQDLFNLFNVNYYLWRQKNNKMAEKNLGYVVVGTVTSVFWYDVWSALIDTDQHWSTLIPDGESEMDQRRRLETGEQYYKQEGKN